MTVTAIVGAQWGDEGKGRIVDYLAQNSDVVIRYQGGDNAGHTVVNDLGNFRLHVIPSGIFNPQTTFGQVAGGVHMGVGYALMEEFIQEDGQVRTGRLSEYYVPTVRDMPLELDSRIVEVPDPTGPFGAKGLGEITLVTTAPAVLNAIYDAVGVRIPNLPATPERVWREMRGQ